MAIESPLRLTAEEYLAWEESNFEKHEYIDYGIARDGDRLYLMDSQDRLIQATVARWDARSGKQCYPTLFG